MKSFIYFTILLITLQINAQNDYKCVFQQGGVGMDLVNDKALRSDIVSFHMPIYELYVDSTMTDVYVDLRQMNPAKTIYKRHGGVISLDLKNKKEHWYREVNYNKNAILHYNNKLIEFNNRNTKMIDLLNGGNLWQSPTKLVWAFGLKDVGLGYAVGNEKKTNTMLQGVSLINGGILWSRDIARTRGWHQIFAIDSSTIIIKAMGAHMLNIKTGQGWSYQDRGDKALYNAWKDGSGANIITDQASNILYDSLNFYYSAPKEMIKLDLQGETVWSFQWPTDHPSKGLLIDREDDILIVNYGWVSRAYGTASRGRPFISLMTKEDGRRHYFNNIITDPILDVRLYDHYLMACTKNGIFKINISDGRITHQKAFDKKKEGKIVGFAAGNLYQKDTDTNYHHITDYSKDNVHVFTRKKKIISLSPDLGMLSETTVDSLFRHRIDVHANKLITNGKETYIIDDDGKVIYQLYMNSNIFKFQNQLFGANNERLHIIDLTDLNQ